MFMDKRLIMTETGTIKPHIIIDNYQGGGYHNRDLEKSRERLSQAKTYKDLSTICIIPTRGMIHYKVVQSWMSLMAPMNQKFLRIFVAGLEVGDAYNTAVEMILANPELSKWKYIMTLEEDNCPPPDGLLKLYENMDKVDVSAGSTITISGIGPGDVVIGGNTTGTTADISSGTLTLAGGNNITLSQNGNAITISGQAIPDFGISNVGNTSGTSGTVNAQLILAGGNNITVSQSINGQLATITISAGAAAGAVKIFEPHKGVGLAGHIDSQGDMRLQPFYIPFNMTATQMNIIQHISHSSSGGLTETLFLGLYTYTQSTANTISTASRLISYNSTLGTSYTNHSGTRYRSISLDNWAFTPGDYLLGILFSTATQVAAATLSFFGRSSLSIVGSEIGGGGINQWGFDGHFTAAISVVPASLNISDINRTGVSPLRQPWVLFQGAY